MNDMLTHLERAGSSALLPRTATLMERNALALHLIALKKQGHAVQADETYESGETVGDLRVIHFLTCKACERKVL